MQIAINDHKRIDGPELELFTAQSGNWSARVRFRDGVFRHLHSLVEPEKEHTFFNDIELWGEVIVLLGTGLGYHLAHRLRTLPAATQVILIDVYPELIDYCIKTYFPHRSDTVTGISSRMSDWEDILKKRLSGVTGVQIIKHPASYHSNKVFYDCVLHVIYPYLKESSSAKSETNDVNILLLYGNFFLQEELRHAIITHGGSAVLFQYDTIASIGQYESMLTRYLQYYKPTMIVSVNMKGIDNNGILSALSEQMGIPVIIWFVDDPYPILLHQHRFVTSSMVAFCWEQNYIPWLKEQGFGSVHYLPLATDPGMFAFKGVPNGPLQAEIGFVGTSMGPHFLEKIAQNFLWDNKLQAIVDEVAALVYRDNTTAISEKVHTVLRKQGRELPFSDKRNYTWLCSYIIHTASMWRRRDVINTLIPLGIHTFGDARGWTGICGKQITTHPDTDYRNGLASLYRSIVININITSCQMSTAVNQRVFDIPACGGFVITDNQLVLPDLFEPKEMVVYNDSEELKELIRFYQKNETARIAVTRNAYHRISNEHTYYHRFSTIMKAIPDHF